jgi:hypothetical protein
VLSGSWGLILLIRFTLRVINLHGHLHGGYSAVGPDFRINKAYNIFYRLFGQKKAVRDFPVV